MESPGAGASMRQRARGAGRGAGAPGRGRGGRAARREEEYHVAETQSMKDQRVIDDASATAANGRQVELASLKQTHADVRASSERAFHSASLLDICLEDNPYLRSGYREMGKEDACACVCSAFALHNETMNIWTHGLAFLMVVFLIYLGCVSTCFLISTFYHIFRNHSVRAYANWLIADINGVGLYIFGSVLLVAYFRFQCHDVHRWTYMTLDVLLYLSFFISMPAIVKYKLFNLRTWLFGLLSILGLWAHVHADIRDGFFEWPTVSRNLKLVWVSVCVIGSMVIRNKKVPEKWYPGRFDIFFASHQIFHVLVWLGMCILYSVFYSEFGPASFVDQQQRTCPIIQ